jgi:(2Fe-2S) ferredoxin
MLISKKPMRPMLITNSSFAPPAAPVSGNIPSVSAYLFPSFTFVSGIPDTAKGHESFIRTFLLPESLSALFEPASAFQISRVTHPIILICSHGTRDARCGVLGPLLAAEFRRQLAQAGIVPTDEASHESGSAVASVGMVSHVGGHKWAGNVIVYLPPEGVGMGKNALAGKGVWYGRVEPRHVEGIVRETVLGGKLIEELSRGVRG